jgi:TetR/AcrR family transcriptional repressor of mexJK operon
MDSSNAITPAQARILEAAATLFRRDGFAGTSMDAIAALARMSKRTLYAAFPDKRAILESVLDRFIAARYAAIARMIRDDKTDHAMLLHVAQGLHDAATDDESMTMYRLLVSEAGSLPQLAFTANRDGLAQAVAMLRGPLHGCGVADPDRAALLLYDLVVRAPMHRRLVDIDSLHMDVPTLVDIVLRGVERR